MPSGRTSINDNHSHRYTVNDSGNGQTGRTDLHTHNIRRWIVSLADGHRHTIPRPAEDD